MRHALSGNTSAEVDRAFRRNAEPYLHPISHKITERKYQLQYIPKLLGRVTDRQKYEDWEAKMLTFLVGISIGYIMNDKFLAAWISDRSDEAQWEFRVAATLEARHRYKDQLEHDMNIALVIHQYALRDHPEAAGLTRTETCVARLITKLRIRFLENGSSLFMIAETIQLMGRPFTDRSTCTIIEHMDRLDRLIHVMNECQD